MNAEGATLPPQISSITKSGSNVTILWVNTGTLEWTAALTGATTVWASTGDSDGSFTELAVESKRFYRVRQ